MTYRISPNFDNEKFGDSPNLDQKILIFEDRVLGWHLDIAEAIREQIEDPVNAGKSIQHAGFALLAILFYYFEMIHQYRTGRSSENRSKQAFVEGLEHVLPNVFDVHQKTTIYKRVRCGMFHNGFVKQGVLISSDYPEAISIAAGSRELENVLINPHALCGILRRHFVDYISILKDPVNAEERAKFERMFVAPKTY